MPLTVCVQNMECHRRNGNKYDGKRKKENGSVLPGVQALARSARSIEHCGSQHPISRLICLISKKSLFYKKGDFIIPMNQPYSSFIKVMMERQHYPEIKHMKDGPIIEPYDAAGWTMPLQMGVKTTQLNNTLEDIKLIRVKNLTYPGEGITGEGHYYCIPTATRR